MKWFRFYHETLDDPKVQLLNDRRFRQWVNLLCVANQSSERGMLPSAEAIAFRLRETLDETLQMLADFEEVGLIDRFDDDTFQPHNWDQRQFKSDDVTGRVEKHRNRVTSHANNVGTNVTGNGQRNVSETVTETFSDTETETETEEAAAPTREAAEILTSATWVGDDMGGVLKGLCRAFRLVPEFDSVEAPVEAEKFVRWHSGSGRKKRNPPDDWYRAWLNWIKRAARDKPLKATNSLDRYEDWTGRYAESQT